MIPTTKTDMMSGGVGGGGRKDSTSSNNSSIKIVADNVKSAGAAAREVRSQRRKEWPPTLSDEDDDDDDDDDFDDFPFFAPERTAMQQQRCAPPKRKPPAANTTSTMSPKSTNPNAMSDAASTLALTTSNSSGRGINGTSQQFRHRGGSPSSPADDRIPTLPPRPGGPRRTASQDGNFFINVKKGKEQVKQGGLKAASFLDKVSHVAWDKIKSPRLNPGVKGVAGRASSPLNGNKYDPNRDTSNDVDVFGMELKEAVIKTRIISHRKMAGDATYWIPAIAYRCLQYVPDRLSGAAIVT
jgi:hypothetical protein